jgi:hypothetical protein
VSYELNQPDNPQHGQPDQAHVVQPQAAPPYWIAPFLVGTPGHPEYNTATPEMARKYKEQQDLVMKSGGGHQGQNPPQGIPPHEADPHDPQNARRDQGQQKDPQKSQQETTKKEHDKQK